MSYDISDLRAGDIVVREAGLEDHLGHNLSEIEQVRARTDTSTWTTTSESGGT